MRARICSMNSPYVTETSRRYTGARGSTRNTPLTNSGASLRKQQIGGSILRTSFHHRSSARFAQTTNTSRSNIVLTNSSANKAAPDRRQHHSSHPLLEIEVQRLKDCSHSHVAIRTLPFPVQDSSSPFVLTTAFVCGEPPLIACTSRFRLAGTLPQPPQRVASLRPPILY